MIGYLGIREGLEVSQEPGLLDFSMADCLAPRSHPPIVILPSSEPTHTRHGVKSLFVPTLMTMMTADWCSLMLTDADCCLRICWLMLIVMLTDANWCCLDVRVCGEWRHQVRCLEEAPSMLEQQLSSPPISSGGGGAWEVWVIPL